MKRFFIIFLSFITILGLNAQEWTEPVNISNMEGVDRQPDITIDGNGKIHCVWVHDIESNFTKIYYSSSDDDGITWTTPEDISQNEEKWVGSPIIVSDTSNHLFLTYDYNVGDPNNTIILFKRFSGNLWSLSDTITLELPGSRYSNLVLDTNERLYCFWHHDINHGSTFYKYFENGIWSDTISLYPGNDFLYLENVVCDRANRLHIIGSYHAFGETHDDDRVIYTMTQNNNWLPIYELSGPTNPGEAIAVDSSNNPHVAFRQQSPGTPNDNDSTMYRYLTDAGWSEAELVVEDPRRQKILVDENNQPNIFDIEKTAEGTMLVHHYKQNNIWKGFIVAESIWNTIHYAIANNNYYLYSVCLLPGVNDDSEIFFTKTGIITGLTKPNNGFDLPVKMYPNPFREKVHIRIQSQAEEKIQARIYTMQGKLINTILDETKPPGIHELIWDGKNENGSPVKGGLYLVRVRIGNNIFSRSVELVK
jgi:hypothetical protein